MRQKTLKAVLTFERTHDAIAMEAYCKDKGLPGRMIPIPTAISAGCGLSWMVIPEEQEQVKTAVEAAGLDCGKWYELML